MVKNNIWIVIILLLVVSCSPSGEAADIEPEVDPVNEEAPLNTAVPADSPDASEPTDLPEPTAETPPQADEDSGEQSSDPTVIDLSTLTPSPAQEDAGGNVVQPAPGVPDPTAKLIQDVSADLSSRLGVDVGDVELVSIAETTWSDSSLGCPQPGMAYLQVLTNGFRVTLKANDAEHNYHTKGTSTFVYCLANTKGDEPITLPISPDQ